MKQKKKKTSAWPFIGIFLVLILIMIISNLIGKKAISLPVPNNAGAPFLETAGNSLVCVFQDGQTCIWDWRQLPGLKKSFQLKTNRVVVLKEGVLATVNLDGPKQLSVIDWETEETLFEFEAGFEDQQIWPRISLDKSVFTLIRKNAVNGQGKLTYEFLTADIEKKYTDIPTSLTIDDKEESLVDFTVSSDSILYAIGKKKGEGRIIALDLQKRVVLWDQVYDQAQEFCSVIISTDEKSLLAGNRDGVLYKLSPVTGEIIEKIQLLEEGEKRPITNDYSVLNLAVSNDGRYYAATINPPAYILETDSDNLVHKFAPAAKLASKIVFSPDSRFVATSDIRAGYPIKIWELPESKK